jgi:hypothetical protein
LSKRLLETIVAALAIAILVAGCGGGGSGAPVLSKAEFIEQGDEICADAEAELEDEINDYGHDLHIDEVTGPNRKQELGIVTDVILPRFKALAGELGELGPPEGEEAQVGEIVEGLEEVVTRAEADPRVVIGGANPFEAVSEKAAKFGFKVCGEA